MHNSCSRRAHTTTAPQALLLLNGDSTREAAHAWAVVLQARHGSDLNALAADAYRSVWGRRASQEEVRVGVAFIRKASRGRQPPEAAAEFCHALLNANETLSID